MSMKSIAIFGGVYSNHLALEALLEDVSDRGIDQIYCLGDLGGFGPHPDRTCDILREAGVQVMQGNYDNSIGHDLSDCQCGYTDAKDNYFARVSYDYTYRNTGSENKKWMRELPQNFVFDLAGKRVRLCHGSPRKMNEFLWDSTSSTAFLDRLCTDFEADIIVATHTGLHWRRELLQGRQFINCGVIGRPSNDGQRCVWYTILNACANGEISHEFIPLAYDHERLAAEMRAENLPEEFVDTIETGWWTTCLEILPAKERARGIY
jgi:diadenosine tetraphosphatase ApaH/serine/threonine PP2A family protein phosphatase